MNAQRFEIVPPGKFARVVPLLIGLLPPIGILLTVALAPHDQATPIPLAPIVAAMLVCPVVAAGLAWSMHRRSVQLADGRLAFGLLPWRRIALDAFDLEAARIVDLETQRELQPVFKIAGSGLPGYKSGLFRLRNRVRAQVLLTDWKRVLVLPKRDGGMVLLSPERPDALLAALQQATGTAR